MCKAIRTKLFVKPAAYLRKGDSYIKCSTAPHWTVMLKKNPIISRQGNLSASVGSGEENPPITSQKYVFFVVIFNKRSSFRWFERPKRSCDITVTIPPKEGMPLNVLVLNSEIKSRPLIHWGQSKHDIWRCIFISAKVSVSIAIPLFFTLWSNWL